MSGTEWANKNLAGDNPLEVHDSADRLSGVENEKRNLLIVISSDMPWKSKPRLLTMYTSEGSWKRLQTRFENLRL